MSSWAAQQAIRNIVLVAVVGAALYGLYVFIGQQGQASEDADDECRAHRARIVRACTEICEEPSDSPMPVQVLPHGDDDPECLNQCAMERFGEPVPVCASRR